MCGIVGFNWQDKKLIISMSKELSHRGPDNQGIYIDKNFSLGHRRLSIVDLSVNGNQPMFNEDGTIVLIFNGEIYNFKKIKEDLQKKGHIFKSDTDSEVIIHCYEEYGENISSFFDGKFAYAVWDLKNKKLIISRDRIGVKPIYYYFDKKKFIFASEIKAILLDNSVKREIDLQCLSDYLTLRFSQGENTIFKGIKKLEPGKYLIYYKNKIKIKDYWTLPEIKEKFNPNIIKLNELIKDSIEKRLMADVPIGVFLSGGLDSSTLVAYMSKLTDKVKTFSIGFNDPTDELKYAKIIAEKFNTEHTEIISSEDILSILPKVVWHLDEPMADPACLPTYILSKQVSNKVKVILSGEGGDEVFGGYSDFNYIKYLKKIQKIPPFIRKNILSNSSLFISNFFKYPNKQILKLSSEVFYSDNLKESYKKLHYSPFEKEDKSNLLPNNNINFSTALDFYIENNDCLENNVFRYYFKEWVPNDILLKADKMGMANALEIRVPYLDTKLVEYSLGLDNKFKQDRFLFRQIVNKILPKSILKRKKQGFTLPISNWFCKKDFLSKIKPHFADLEKRRIFDNSYYNKIINNPSSFKNDHRMWVLLNFELWCKIYLDRISYKKILI